MNIFISHSSKDKYLAEKISTLLKENGINTFLPDQDSISPGESIVATIADAILSSDGYLFLISKRSVENPFIGYEVSMAFSETQTNEDKILIPILLDKDSSPPFFLRDIQFIDMSNEDLFQKNSSKLISAIKQPKTIYSDKKVIDYKIQYLKDQSETLTWESWLLKSEILHRSMRLRFNFIILGILLIFGATILSFFYIGTNLSSILYLLLGCSIGSLLTIIISLFFQARRGRHIIEEMDYKK